MNSIVFTDYPGNITAFLLVSVTVILLLYSFRTSIFRSLPVLRWVLGALSFVVILVLIVLTWNPSRVNTIEKKEQNTLLVCFDTSESMSVTEQQQSRLDQALTAFDQHLINERTDRPRFQFYGFDSNCRVISRQEFGSQWGNRSDLETAITKLIRYGQAESGTGEDADSNICGTIIFTDGQVENKQVMSYAKLKGSDRPLVIIGCGDDRPFKDVVVGAVKAPVSVRVEQQYDIVTQVAALGSVEQSVEVQLWINDLLADRTDISISKEGKWHDVYFSAHALAAGIDEVKVVATSVDGELNIHNNSRMRLVEVQPDDTLRVLLYSQVANFDIGKIRQCLSRDSRVQLDFIYDAIIDPKLRKEPSDNLVRFPGSAAEFNRYDLIILGSSRFDQFSDKQVKGLYDFVTKRGGSIIFLPGKLAFGLERCKIDKVCSLVPADFDGSMASNPIYGLSITEEGRDQRYSEDVCNESRSDDIDVAYSHLRKKPAASTVLRCGRQALVCTQRIGRGKTAILNSRNIYQLYREDEEGGSLFTLLSDIVADVEGPNSKQSLIEAFVRRSDDTTGLIFEACVKDQTYTPAQKATVLLEFEDHITSMREVLPGTYKASIPDFQGNSVFARVRVEHSGFYLGEKAVSAELPDVRHEMDDIRSDKKFLQTLCDHIGARYIDINEISENKDEFNKFQSYRTGVMDRQLQRVWSRWWLFGILCSILFLQWFLRRAKGLI